VKWRWGLDGAKPVLPREAPCVCGWAYPIVLANLVHTLVTPGTVENEPGGFLYRCPACERLYSVTPAGRTVHSTPRPPAPQQQRATYDGDPHDEPRPPQRAVIPEDTEPLWNMTEPGGRA